MSTDIEVANRCLAILGEPSITALSDPSKAARTITANYDSIRDALLRSYRWKFAMKRVQLVADTDAPLFGFDYAYTLPSDFLRLDFVQDAWVWFATGAEWRGFSEGAYAIEGRKILTNLTAPIEVRYVSRVGAELFDPAFVEALAARMATSLALAITQSEGKKAEARKDFGEAIRMAVQSNAIESPPQQMPDNEWMMSRIA